MPDSTKSQQPKLLDQVRQVLRLHHYSIHTERSYVDWIVRFVRFHSTSDERDVVHNDHIFRPSEFLLFIAIAMAEVPTPNLLAISAMEIPISRLK